MKIFGIEKSFENISPMRTKDIVFYINLTITLKYLPKILAKLSKENNITTNDTLFETINSGVENIRPLRPYERKYLTNILSSATKKGMNYKKFKLFQEKRLLSKATTAKILPNKIYYYEEDTYQIYFAFNQVLSNTIGSMMQENEELRENISKEIDSLYYHYKELMISESKVRR